MKTERIDVPVAGGVLATYRLGNAEDGAPAVVLSHGITGNHAYWTPVVRALGDRFAIYAPDHRGRGESRTLGEPFGLASHADDLLAIADHVGLDRAVYAGHSMGAYAVARLAVDHPERVASAVLVDGAMLIPGSDQVDVHTFMAAFLGPTLARLDMRFASLEEYLGFWHAHPAFRDQGIFEDDLVAFARHDLIGSSPDLHSSVAHAAISADVETLPGAHLAADAITVQTTLLQAPRGLQDNPEPMVPLETAHAWAAGDPDTRTVVQVPDTNHYSIVIGRGAQQVAETIAASPR